VTSSILKRSVREEARKAAGKILEGAGFGGGRTAIGLASKPGMVTGRDTKWRLPMISRASHREDDGRYICSICCVGLRLVDTLPLCEQDGRRPV
jgi:hypothetical protein